MASNRTLISLFTGAGGLDLGLEQAGFTTIVSNEIEPQACETLKKNKRLCNLETDEVEDFINKAMTQRCFNRLTNVEKKLFSLRMTKNKNKEKYLQESSVIEGDIRNISSNEFKKYLNNKDLYCIAGGPPCQPFSKAGKQKSFDCAKNGDLFYQFVRLVKELKPKWFIFENVKGITFTKTDVLYHYCNSCKSREIAPFNIRQDFESHNKKIKCSNCGSPNTEWLVDKEPGGSLKIIVNEFEKIEYKCTYKVLNAADYGAPQIRERLFIIGNLEGKEFIWPEATHQNPKKQGLQQELFQRNNLKPWVTMYDSLWTGTHPIYGKFNKNKAKLWVKNVVRPHDEPVTWGFDRPSPTIGAHQGAKLAFAPNGVPEKQLYRQQWATKGRKQGDTPPVKVEHQYLSDGELLKLQTFPEWWYLHGTRMQRAFQIGNAVPPILSKAVGKALITSDKLNGN